MPAEFSRSLRPFTVSTLRPDYSAMIGSSYDLQTALNQRALQNLQPSEQAQSGLGSLVQQYNQSFQQARSANEARYQQLLGIADQTTAQRGADIRGAYGQLQSDTMQQLARSGLGGTTIAPTMKAGISRERGSALNRLADQMQQTKLGIIERRTDAYPSMDPMMSALQSYGQQYGGAGLEGMIQALGQMRV